MQNGLSPLMILVHGCGFALLLLAVAVIAAAVERGLKALADWAKLSERLASLLESVALCIAGIDLGLYLKLVIVHALPLLLGSDGGVA